MGTFCTTTSLETLWVGSTFTAELTSLAGDLISDSEDELRSCFAQRYDITTDAFQTSTATPPMLEKLCKWKAIGYLYEATARGSKDAFKRSSRYLDRCDKKINEIRDYKAHLLDSSGAQIPDSTGKLLVKSTTQDFTPTFLEDDELKWRQDKDKLDDIDSERS